jgi:phage N-6-adenine-methyltransferase
VSLVGFRAKNHPQQVLFSGPRRDVDDRALPVEEFAKLHERFRFTVDAAASPENARLPRYWTREDCGLRASWAGERVWCNPPYSAITPWVAKAWNEPAAELIVMLLPANRTEQSWWQDLVEPHRDRGGVLRVEFLPGRIRFLAPGRSSVGPNERPPFGCCLCIWASTKGGTQA